LIESKKKGIFSSLSEGKISEMETKLESIKTLYPEGKFEGGEIKIPLLEKSVQPTRSIGLTSVPKGGLSILETPSSSPISPYKYSGSIFKSSPSVSKPSSLDYSSSFKSSPSVSSPKSSLSSSLSLSSDSKSLGLSSPSPFKPSSTKYISPSPSSPYKYSPSPFKPSPSVPSSPYKPSPSSPISPYKSPTPSDFTNFFDSPTKKPPVPIPVNFNFPKGKKRKFSKSRKQKKPKTKYSPSLAGISLGRMISKAPKRVSGLGIRPVVKRKKKKRTNLFSMRF